MLLHCRSKKKILSSSIHQNNIHTNNTTTTCFHFRKSNSLPSTLVFMDWWMLQILINSKTGQFSKWNLHIRKMNMQNGHAFCFICHKEMLLVNQEKYKSIQRGQDVCLNTERNRSGKSSTLQILHIATRSVLLIKICPCCIYKLKLREFNTGRVVGYLLLLTSSMDPSPIQPY